MAAPTRQLARVCALAAAACLLSFAAPAVAETGTEALSEQAGSGVRVARHAPPLGGRYVRVWVLCSSFDATPCVGRLHLIGFDPQRKIRGGAGGPMRERPVGLGIASFALAPGTGASIPVRLSWSGRRLLRRAGQVRARALLVDRMADGVQRTDTRSLTVRGFRR